MYKINKEWVKDEIRSFILTFFAVFVVEAGLFLVALYNGDASTNTLMALAYAAGRSVVKTVLQLIFPSLFPGSIKPLKKTYE